MRRRTLTLTDAARAELIALRDHDSRPYLRERAAALLRVAAGESPHAVARHGILKPRAPDTLYDWLKRYAIAGVAGLIQKPRRARGFSPGAGGGTRGDGAADT